MLDNLHEDLCRFSCPHGHKIAIKAFLTLKCSVLMQKKCKKFKFFTDQRLLERTKIFHYVYFVSCCT